MSDIENLALTLLAKARVSGESRAYVEKVLTDREFQSYAKQIEDGETDSVNKFNSTAFLLAESIVSFRRYPNPKYLSAQIERFHRTVVEIWAELACKLAGL